MAKDFKKGSKKSSKKTSVSGRLTKKQMARYHAFLRGEDVGSE